MQKNKHHNTPRPFCSMAKIYKLLFYVFFSAVRKLKWLYVDYEWNLIFFLWSENTMLVLFQWFKVKLTINGQIKPLFFTFFSSENQVYSTFCWPSFFIYHICVKKIVFIVFKDFFTNQNMVELKDWTKTHWFITSQS